MNHSPVSKNPAGATTTRLVIVSGSYPPIPCGVAPHVRHIAERLAQQGDWEVHVLTSAEAAADDASAHGYTVHPWVTTWRRRDANPLAGMILDLRPTVVLVQNPSINYRRWNAGLMSAVVASLKRHAPALRVVVQQHDLAPCRPLLRWRYRRLLRTADAVIVSNRRDEQAARAQAVPAERIWLAPVSALIPLPPRRPHARSAARQRLGIAADAYSVAYFGYVQPSRGIHVLIRALHRLHRRGVPIQASIIGGVYPGCAGYYQRCRRLAERLGLAQRILWTGYAEAAQIADGLMAADVFVSCPQRGADLRNTSIITAMLAELPIITTRNPRYYDDPDLQRFGCTLVKPGDVGGLAQALEAVRATPPEAAVLRRRAALLDPTRLWNIHIDRLSRALRGETPLDADIWAGG